MNLTKQQDPGPSPLFHKALFDLVENPTEEVYEDKILDKEVLNLHLYFKSVDKLTVKYYRPVKPYKKDELIVADLFSSSTTAEKQPL
jgi:hypothetical protein